MREDADFGKMFRGREWETVQNADRSKIEVPRGTGILMRFLIPKIGYFVKSKNRIQNASIETVGPPKHRLLLVRIDSHLNNGITSEKPSSQAEQARYLTRPPQLPCKGMIKIEVLCKIDT